MKRNSTMLDQLKRLAGHSFVYGLSGMVNAAMALILTPLYARYLAPANYGVMTILTATAAFGTIFFQLGLGSAVFRSVIQRGVDKRIVFSTAFHSLIVLIISVLSISFLLSGRLSMVLFGAWPNGPLLLRLVFVTVALDSIAVIPLAKLRVEERSVFHSIVSACNFLLGMLLNVYFVAILRHDVEGVVTANLIRSVVYAVGSTMILLPDVRLVFSSAELGELLHFGVPLVPISVGALILSMADRYFVGYFGSLAEVGVYSLGYKVGSLVQLPVVAFQVAWPAALFTIHGAERARDTYARLLTYYVLLIGIMTFVVSVFAREIVTVIASADYADGWRVVALVALSQVLFGVYSVTAVGVNVERRLEHLVIVWLVGVAVHLVLNFVLISRYGMMGAAVSTLVGYAVVAVGATIASLRLYFIPYEYGRVIKLALVLTGLYLVSLMIPLGVLGIRLTSKVLLVVSLPVLLRVTGFFTDGELARSKGALGEAKTRILGRLRHGRADREP